MIFLLKKICCFPILDRPGSNKGFSLMELMIALAIFSIVVAGIVSARIGQQSQSISQTQAVEMQQSVRAPMYLMTWEIRMVGYNPHENDYGEGVTNAGIGTSGDPFTFAYVADNDGNDNDNDGMTDEDGELSKRSYYLDAGNILRVDYLTGGGGQRLAENIKAVTFDYLDENNASLLSGPAVPASDIEDIRAVQVTITATSDATVTGALDYSPENNTRTLETTVTCRNLGL